MLIARKRTFPFQIDPVEQDAEAVVMHGAALVRDLSTFDQRGANIE